MLGALAVGMAVGDEKPEPSEAKTKRQPRKRTKPRKAAANSDDRRSQPAAVALGGAKPARKAQGEEELRKFNQDWLQKSSILCFPRPCRREHRRDLGVDRGARRPCTAIGGRRRSLDIVGIDRTSDLPNKRAHDCQCTCLDSSAGKRRREGGTPDAGRR